MIEGRPLSCGYVRPRPGPATNFAKPKNPPSKRIFMGNTAYNIDDKSCKKFWEDCGEVVDIYWILDKNTKRFKRAGIVEFATQEAADKAILKTGTMFMGKELNCNYMAERADSKFSRPKAARVNDDSENPPSKRIFMGNLPYSIDDEKCKEFWKDCGELVDIYWICDANTKRFKGIGIVEFATQEAADKAILKNGTEIMGRKMNCNYARARPETSGEGLQGRWSRQPGEKPAGCDSIFLGNVADAVNDDNIRQIFEECGEITRIHWVTDHTTGKFKGCGLVQFGNPDVALPIAIALHGMNLCGKVLNIDYSRSQKTH